MRNLRLRKLFFTSAFSSVSLLWGPVHSLISWWDIKSKHETVIWGEVTCFNIWLFGEAKIRYRTVFWWYKLFSQDELQLEHTVSKNSIILSSGNDQSKWDQMCWDIQELKAYNTSFYYQFICQLFFMMISQQFFYQWWMSEHNKKKKKSNFFFYLKVTSTINLYLELLFINFLKPSRLTD